MGSKRRTKRHKRAKKGGGIRSSLLTTLASSALGYAAYRTMVPSIELQAQRIALDILRDDQTNQFKQQLKIGPYK